MVLDSVLKGKPVVFVGQLWSRVPGRQPFTS